MSDFEKGDRVIILDNLRHPTKIRGVVIGFLRKETYNILLTNGLQKGIIKSYKIYNLEKEGVSKNDLGKSETRKIFEDNNT